VATSVAPLPAVAPHAAPPPLGPVRRGVRELGLGLITLGVVILLFVAYQLFGTNLTEANNQQQLQRGFAQNLRAHGAPATGATASPVPGPAPSPPLTTPSPSPLPSDSPTVGDTAPGPLTDGAIDRMVIPKIGVDKFVVDSTTESALTRGPGHYTGTVYPGQVGNAGIAGHRTTYGAPFYRLDQLTVGDDIFFTDTTGAVFRYQVDQAPLVVAPSDVGVLAPTADARLTLTTCNPRFSATTRLIIKAKLVGLPAPVAKVPVATPRPVAPAPARNLTGGNHSAWPPALLWGAAVILAWVATRIAIHRTRRWSRAGALTGGVALTCVPLWFTFENVVRLLPQSI